MQQADLRSARRLCIQRPGQRCIQTDRQPERGRAAAVDRSAGPAGDLRCDHQPAPLIQRTDAVEAVKFMGRKAHGVHAVQPEVRFANGLCCVHMQAAAGVRFDELCNFPNGLHGAQFTVHGADCYQNRIIAQQLPQLVKVYPTVTADAQQVDLVFLLLQDG